MIYIICQWICFIFNCHNEVFYDYACCLIVTILSVNFLVYFLIRVEDYNL